MTPMDNLVRVTFDREVSATAYDGEFALPDMALGVHPPIHGVILEVKFTDRFPRWLADMVRVFDLERQSMAKYVACVETMRRPGRLIARIIRPGYVEVRP